MDETNEDSGILELKQIARWLYKYEHLCDMWDHKKILIYEYAFRMTNLEWKINSLVHQLQKQGVPVEVVFYRNMDERKIHFFHDKKEVTGEMFAAFFM